MNTWANLIYLPEVLEARIEIFFILYYPPELMTCKFRAARRISFTHVSKKGRAKTGKRKDKNEADTLREAEMKVHTKKRWSWGMKKESKNRRDRKGSQRQRYTEN